MISTKSKHAHNVWTIEQILCGLFACLVRNQMMYEFPTPDAIFTVPRHISKIVELVGTYHNARVGYTGLSQIQPLCYKFTKSMCVLDSHHAPLGE